MTGLLSNIGVAGGPAGNAAAIVSVATLIGALEAWLSRGAPRRFLERCFADADAKALKRNVYQVIIRIIGLLHLAIQLPLAVAVLGDPQMQTDRLYSTSARSGVMLCISAGYFLHDLFNCVTKFEEWGVPYLLHALVCCSLYSYGAITGCLHYYGAMFLLWEASTPCVYVRWALHKLGKSDSTAYVVNGVLMLVTFFLARNVFGIAMSVDFYRVSSKELTQPRPGGIAPGLIWGYRIANLLLNGLNAFWVYKMGNGATKLLLKPKQPAKKAQ